MSLRKISVLAGAVAAALSVGCQNIVEIPSGTNITCSESEACPAGWVCSTTIGRCVKADELDGVPPALVGQAGLSPTLLKDGATATLTVEVSEPLFGFPEVKLALPAGAKALVLDEAASSGNRYVYSYTANGNEPEGAETPIEIVLIDRQGNKSSALPGGRLRFDFTAPRAQASFDKAWLRNGATAKLTVVADEPLAGAPGATFEDGGTALSLESSGAQTWGFTYTATGAEPASRTVALALTDLAGNQAALPAAASVKFDFVAPDVVAAPAIVPLVAKQGTEVELTFNVTEDLAADPAVALTVDGNTTALQGVPRPGRGYRYSYTVPAGVNGLAAVQITLADFAGNQTVLNPPGFSADTSVPDATLVGFSPAGPYRSPQGAEPELTFETRFSLSEPLSAQAADGQVALTVGNYPTSCADVAGELRCALTMPRNQTAAGSGAYPVKVTLTDAAGNRAVQTLGSVDFDFTFPSVTAPALSRTRLNAGAVLALTFTASEQVGAPTVELVGAGTFTRDLSVVAPDYRYTYAAAGTEPEATPLEARILVTDLAGNGTTRVLDTPVTFDFTPPATVSGVSISPADARVGTAVDVGFLTTEAMASVKTTVTPSGGAPVTLTNGGSGTRYEYTFTVGAGTPNGVAAVAIELEDLAGNQVTLGPGTFEVDTAAPAVLNYAVSPAGPYRSLITGEPAQDIELRFDSSEPLSASQVIARVGTTPVTCSAGAGNAFVCAYPRLFDQSSAASGLYPVVVTLTDDAGNPTTFPGGNLEFDFTPPQLTAGSVVVGDTRLALGQTAEVVFEVSEALPALPQLRLSNGLTFTGTELGPRQYRFTYSAQGSEPQDLGGFAAEVVLTDAAGNVTTAPLASRFYFDFVAPAPTALKTSHAYARLGDTVSVSFDCTDVFTADPVVTATLSDASTPPLQGGNLGGGRFSYSYSVGSGSAEGAVALQLQLTDAAGNGTTLTPTGFTIDRSPPTVSSYSASPAGPFRSPTGSDPDQTVTLGFALSEDLQAEQVSATVGSIPTTCVRAAAAQFSCSFDVPRDQPASASGMYAVTFTATDAAQNRTVYNGAPLEFDFTAPQLTSLALSRTRLRSGGLLEVTFSASEPIDPPQVRLVGVGDLTRDPAVLHPAYRYTYAAAGTEAQGVEREVQITAVDPAGNQAVRSAAQTVSFDFLPPSTTGGVAISPLFGKVGSTIDITFEASEALAAARAQVTPNGAASAVNLANTGAGSRYAYAFTVGGGTGNGLAAVRVELEDLAGNLTVLDPGSFTVDTVPPTVSSLSVTPAGPYRSLSSSDPPATIEVALTTSEDLAIASGQLGVKVGTTALGCVRQAASTFLCSMPRPVDQPSSASGLYPLEAWLTDSAQNATFHSGGNLLFDFTPPTLAGAATLDQSELYQGEQAALVFTASEPLAQPPTVRLNTVPLPVELTLDPASTPPSYRYTYAALGTEAEYQPFPLEVALRDPAGNETLVPLGSTISFDFDPPQVSALARTHEFASRDQVVGVSFTSVDSFRSAPTVTATFSDNSTLALDGGDLGGGKFSYSYTVDGFRPDGPVTLELRLEDSAGNVTLAPGGSFTLDTATPVLVAQQVSPSTNLRSPQGAEPDLPVTITLTTSEVLAPSQVAVALGTYPATCAPGAGAADLVCSLNMPRDMTSASTGWYPVTVTLTDNAGNTSTDSNYWTYFDFTYPVQTAVTPATQYNRAGVTYYTTFTFSEPLASPPVVTLADQALTFLDQPCCGNRYRYTYVPAGTESQDPAGLPVTTVATDPAGNVTTRSDAALVYFDFVAPTLRAATSVEVSTRIAKAGTVISVSFESDDTSGNPLVTLRYPSGTTYSLSGGALGGGLYRYSLTVSGHPEGSPSLNVRLSDLAGNQTNIDAGQVTIDKTAPTITNVVMGPRGAGPYRSPQDATADPESEIFVTFNTSEPVDPSTGLSVTAGSYALSCAADPGSALPNGFRCAMNLPRNLGPADDGWALLTLRASDAAGNSWQTSPAYFQFDFTVPEFSWNSLYGTPATTGRVIELYFGITEQIDAEPSVTFVTNGVTRTMVRDTAYTSGPSSYWHYTYTVGTELDEGAGTKDLTLSLVDNAGNVATLTTLDLVFDFTAPQLIAAASSTTPSVARAGQDVWFEFETDEPTQGTPWVVTYFSNGGGASVTNGYSLGGNKWRFWYTVQAAAADGPATVNVQFTDLAGNTTDTSLPGYQVDKSTSPPDGVAFAPSGPVRSPQGAEPDITVTLTFTTAEPCPLPGGVQVTVSSPTWSPVTCQSPTGTNTDFSCTWNVPRNEGPANSGVYPVTVTLTDVAGNVSTSKVGSVEYDFGKPTVYFSSTDRGPHRAGAVAEVTFEVSEALGGDPIVRLASGTAMTKFSQSGTVYTYRYTALGTESQDAAGVAWSVELTDPAGNTSTEAQPDSLLFDFVAPTAALGPSISPAWANAGDTVVLTATASEDLKPLPTRATFNALDMSETNVDRDFTFTYQVTGSDAQGPATVSLHLVDKAGNTTDLPVPGVTVDLVAPSFSAITFTPSTPVRSPAAVDPDLVVSARFNVSEALTATQVSATIDKLPMSCATTGTPNQFDCSYNSPKGQTDAAPAHAWNNRSIDVVGTLTDNAGNTTTQLLGQFRFDFTSPTVVSPVLTRTPRAGALLTSSQITKMHLGATAELVFRTSEPVKDASLPSMVRAYKASPVTQFLFGTSNTTGTDSLFTYSWTLTLAGVPQGLYDVQVQLEDLAGNKVPYTTLALKDLLEVDTAPPVLDGTRLAAVTYSRIPWGQHAPTGIIPRNTYRMINTTVGQVEGSVWALFFDGDGLAGRPRNEIARAQVAINGTFNVPLDGIDRPKIYMLLVDSGANESNAAPQLVPNVQWIVSPGGKLAGSDIENPHYFAERPNFSGTLLDDDRLLSASSGIELIDSSARRSGPAGFFRQYKTFGTPLRDSMAIAYDSNRGRTVVFGGRYNQFNDSDITYEWDGYKLVPVSLQDPEGDGHPQPRYGAVMTFDSRRNKMILFGGATTAGDAFRDTWEYDGVSWKRVAVSGPVARQGHAMAYDTRRRKVRLYGGASGTAGTIYSDNWEFDPATATWSAVASSALTEPRVGASMVYDANLQSLFLFGGAGAAGAYPATFMFKLTETGTDWVPVATATTPGPRSYQAAAFDASTSRIWMFGGDNAGTPNSETWQFTGSGTPTWTQKFPGTVPGVRSRASMAYDAARKSTVMINGFTGTNSLAEVWEWNGTTWRDVETATTPYTVTGPAVGYLSARQSVLAMGGNYGTSYYAAVFENDGVKWKGLATGTVETIAPTTPAGRAFHAASAESGKLVLFGGTTAAGTTGETWVLVNSSPNMLWDRIDSAGPSARTNARMVYDVTGARHLMYGGNSGLTYYSDLWSFSSAGAGTWTNLAPANPPTARYRHGMAMDTTRRKLVMFGGRGGGLKSSVRSDLHEYDPVTNAWALITPTDPEGDGNPSARDGHTMWFDSVRRKVVLFGGSDAAGVLLNDTWEWDGASWRAIPTSDPVGDGRPNPRWQHAAAFNPIRGRALIYGGENTTGSAPETNESWEFDAGGNSRPAYVVIVHFRESGAQWSQVSRVEARFSAGSSVYPNGSLQNGAEISTWDEGRWQWFSFYNSAPATTPALATFVYSAADIQRLAFGTTEAVAWALHPWMDTVNGAGNPQLAFDYADFTFNYTVSP